MSDALKIVPSYVHLWSKVFNYTTTITSICTVQSQFSDTLFSGKSWFSDNFAEDHFLVNKNISINDNLVFSATSI